MATNVRMGLHPHTASQLTQPCNQQMNWSNLTVDLQKLEKRL